MNARLAAALAAVSFALAMCQPRLGIVVHRHAGSRQTHVHVGETGHGAAGHRHDGPVVAERAHHEAGEPAHLADGRHRHARGGDREGVERQGDDAPLPHQHDHDDGAVPRQHHHDVAAPTHAHRHYAAADRRPDEGSARRHLAAIGGAHDALSRRHLHDAAPLTDAEHHNELAALRIDPPPPPPDHASLVAGSFAHAWHTHSSHPFHHAALPVPPIVAAPVAVARLVLLPPHHRGDVAPIPGRSRAPPSVQSS